MHASCYQHHLECLSLQGAVPVQMPAAKRHNIVSLDNWVQFPQLSIDYEHEQYNRTTPDQLQERIKDATIVIISGTPVTRAAIESASKLELIACNGTGTDHVDKEAGGAYGVAVCKVPAQNADSVSEHAFALYYAIRRRIVEIASSDYGRRDLDCQSAVGFQTGQSTTDERRGDFGRDWVWRSRYVRILSSNLVGSN